MRSRRLSKSWRRSYAKTEIHPATIDDTSQRWACFGLWGPAARDVLGAVTEDDVSDVGLPMRRATSIRIGPAPVLAARLSYVGELGWELYLDPEWAVNGLGPAGRGWSRGRTRVDRLPRPGCPADGEGLPILPPNCGPCSRRPIRGRTRGLRPARRGSFHRPGGDHPAARGSSRRSRSPPTHGGHRRRHDVPAHLWGEAVRIGGEVVGRLRSATYGYGVSRTVGYVYLPRESQVSEELSVDVLGAGRAGGRRGGHPASSRPAAGCDNRPGSPEPSVASRQPRGHHVGPARSVSARAGISQPAAQIGSIHGAGGARPALFGPARRSRSRSSRSRPGSPPTASSRRRT